MARKPRILFCSQSAIIHTGYGVIARDILTRLAATGKYDIYHQGWYDPINPAPSYPYESIHSKNFPTFKLLSTGCPPEEQNFELRHGLNNIKQLLEIYKPDITILFADVYFFNWVHKVPELSNTHLIMYYPIDGVPIPPEWINTLKKANTVITYNQFGSGINKSLFPNNSEMIYHGIDYPLWSQPVPSYQVEAKKKEMFGTDEVFIFGMVARNNPRKNIPAFFEAFAHHAQTHPKSRILMHSVIQDFGWDLNRLVNEFGIKDKVYFTPGLTPQQGVPPEQLRLLYNTMDVHVNTAWGEGFGVPIVEAMACGIPNLVTDYSVGPEFIKTHNCGELIKVALYSVETQSNIRRAFISSPHLAQLMDKFYDNKYDKKIDRYDKIARKYSRNGKTAASQFDWAKIIPKWEEIIDKIVAENVSYPIAVEVI